MKKRILIIGDSSALAREELSYIQTYYGQLKSKMSINLENSAMTNHTSYHVFKQLESLMLYGYIPDTVILNYGIVDVYPRPYPRKVYKLLACTGLLPSIDRFLKKSKLYYKLGDFFGFKEVNIDDFKRYSEGIVSKLLDKGVEKIIFIGIIKPDKVLLKSQSIAQDVIVYNGVFEGLSLDYDAVEYIDIYHDSHEGFTIWDGYHYSEEASTYLADKIKKLIDND